MSINARPAPDDAQAVVSLLDAVHSWWAVFAGVMGAIALALRYVVTLHSRLTLLTAEVKGLRQDVRDTRDDIKSIREALVKLLIERPLMHDF